VFVLSVRELRACDSETKELLTMADSAPKPAAPETANGEQPRSVEIETETKHGWKKLFGR
jgi:hypothetical protein